MDEAPVALKRLVLSRAVQMQDWDLAFHLLWQLAGFMFL